MDNQQPSNQEILEAINVFSSHVDEEFSGIKSEISSIRSEMVTKDYLNEKLADLRGDLVVLVRKEDKKLAATLDLLVGKSLITRDEAAVVLALEPFPLSK